MTIDRIPPSALPLLASASGAGSAAGSALAGVRALAVQVLGPITGEFLSGGREPAPAAASLRDLSAALAEALGASPVETVELERAVETLAGALAADLAALADGRTLDRLDAATAAAAADPAMNQAPGAGFVIRMIEDIAAQVAAAR